MTIITRSKSKQLQNANMNNTDDHISTPNLSRYSKKKYPTFNDVLTNSKTIIYNYPLNYKGFYIADETQKKKVDKYLVMIETFISDKKKI